jgi:hypothetical protein
VNVIGHTVVAGIPFINGKAAKLDPPDNPIMLLDGALSEWRCPECSARLSGDDLICLNGCHLSAASIRRFQDLMDQAVAESLRKEHLKEQLKKESGVLGDILGRIEFDRDDG